MSYKIRLLDKKCGLHMDMELEHLLPTVKRVVDYGTGIHEYEYEWTNKWYQGVHVYKHTRTRKLKHHVVQS